MRIGQSQIDFEALLIQGPAGVTSMEPIVMRLLKVFADNPKKVMSREALITAVWGVEYGGDERLSRGISLLRKALGDTKNPRQYIETISRRGYRLIAPISETDNIIISQAAALPHNQSQIKGKNQSETVPKNVESSPVEPAIVGLQAEPKQKIGRTKNNVPFKRWASVAAVSLAAIATISFSVTAISPRLSVPINVRIDDGLYYVENYHQDGAIQRAQDIFNVVLAKDPDHAAARAGIAIALIRKYVWLEADPATLQLATAHADAALRADEHLALANIALAWTTEFNGNLEKAHKLLDRADILDRDNKLSLEARARIFNRQKKPDEVRSLLEHAIKTYPNVPIFQIIMGQFLSGLGEFDNAEKAFEKALKLTQDNPRLYAQLSHVLHMQNKTDEAVKVVQEGLQINETALLYSNLGAYLFFQGHYDLAAGAFEKTLEIGGDTHSFLYWSNLADSYRWLAGREADAKIAYKRAIQLLNIRLKKFPDSSNGNTRLAVYAAKSGDFKTAQSALSKVALEDKLPSVEYYRSAVVYEIMSDRPRALKLLEKAIMAGYPMIEILNDPELTKLRQDMDYHKLLARN